MKSVLANTRTERARQAFADNPSEPEIILPEFLLQPLPWPGLEYWRIDIRIDDVAVRIAGERRAWFGGDASERPLLAPAHDWFELARQWQQMTGFLMAMPWLLLAPVAQYGSKRPE
ncbi:MAG: hypothetical protein HWE39_04575 [Oceanospirillaceae bacterium]|nr:hypothetical protein [Oceanospirillaceae bacterium]